MQTSLYGPLDTAELGRLKTFLSTAASQGVDVVIDLHNYGRYNKMPIGSAEVPTQAFADFWKKLATALKDQPGLAGYDLMNEPHDMGGAGRWPAAAQAATNAIRTVDMKHDIYVEGDGWSGAHSWQRINGNLNIKDPANKIIYEAHQYFDNNNAGIYDASYDGEGAYPNIGVDRLKPFTDWLKATGNKGFIGEFAVPDNDPRWLTVLDRFMDAMKAAGVEGTYWGAGPWWGSYPMALYGPDGKPNPQMATLLEHVDDLDGTTSTPTPTPAPTPTPTPAPTPDPTPEPAPAPAPTANVVNGTDNSETLTGGAGNDTINGKGGHDKLVGLAGNDTLDGGAGSDRLDGGAGADLLKGGTGDEAYVVENSGDKVIEAAGEGSDWVESFISYTLPANVEHLILKGTAALSGTGNELANSLWGNGAANTLNGGAGNDVLVGSGGADSLVGGTGADIFRYYGTGESQGSAIDHIRDFVRGTDKIDLSAIDASSKLAGNQAFNFIGEKGFTGAAGEVQYKKVDLAGTTSDHILVQADTNGDRVADFAIILDGGLSPIQASDFLL